MAAAKKSDENDSGGPGETANDAETALKCGSGWVLPAEAFIETVDVKTDGACLFRVLALALWDDEEKHPRMRELICKTLLKLKKLTMSAMGESDEERFEDYVEKMKKPETWGTNDEFVAFEACFSQNLVCWTPKDSKNGKPVTYKADYVSHLRNYCSADSDFVPDDLNVDPGMFIHNTSTALTKYTIHITLVNKHFNLVRKFRLHEAVQNAQASDFPNWPPVKSPPRAG